MTWDAYNRRKPVLRDVLAIADRRRDITADEAFEIVPEAKNVFSGTTDLLLDAQLLWFQRLNGQMERQLTEGSNTSPEATAIDAWHAAAAAMPGARTLLDTNLRRPEMAKALANEHSFVAIAAGVPDEHPELEARGRFVVEKARDTMVYDLPTEGEATSGLMARLRHALAA
ncbi:hypothetical protein [Aeromicrobium sp.]|uniref:hypothetical protein n=1 Tax=Aeromicrobium sp. TaxID=1871063 RepID=UPI003D6B7809